MKKLLTLLMLVVCSIGSAWAETEKSTGSGAKADNPYVGTCISVDQTYIGGNGSTQSGIMPNKGVKFNFRNNLLVWQVNTGYKITGIKLIGNANKDGGSITFSSITVDDSKTNLLDDDVVFPARNESAGTIELLNIEAEKQIVFTASGTTSQANIYFEITYEVGELPAQEITSVSFNGEALSGADLTTLKTDKAVTIDGSELNGLPIAAVTLSSGTATVVRTIESGSAIFKFTINATEEYTVTITNIARTYEKEGVVIAYKEGDTNATGQNTNTLSLNGITFSMPTKAFQYGTGSVTLGDTKYQPIKLSTGEAVTVTLPDGKVAKKIIIYGWSASNNGKLKALSESENSEKSVDVSQDIYYAGNTAEDVYPSVYSYDVDNWESIYFNAGGSPSQPFIVMDIVFAEEAPAAVTLNSKGYATYSNENTVTLDGAAAYVASVDEAKQVAKFTSIGNVVPANTGVLLVGDAGATVSVELGGTEPDVTANDLKPALTAAATSTLGNVYVLYDDSFVKYTGETLSVNKAYLVMSANFGANNAAPMRMVFGDVTGISEINAAAAAADASVYNLSGQRVSGTAKGLLIKNGKKYINK